MPRKSAVVNNFLNFGLNNRKEKNNNLAKEKQYIVAEEPEKKALKLIEDNRVANELKEKEKRNNR